MDQGADVIMAKWACFLGQGGVWGWLDSIGSLIVLRAKQCFELCLAQSCK